MRKHCKAANGIHWKIEKRGKNNSTYNKRTDLCLPEDRPTMAENYTWDWWHHTPPLFFGASLPVMATGLQVVITEGTAGGQAQCSDNCELIVTRPTHPVRYKNEMKPASRAKPPVCYILTFRFWYVNMKSMWLYYEAYIIGK